MGPIGLIDTTMRAAVNSKRLQPSARIGVERLRARSQPVNSSSTLRPALLRVSSAGLGKAVGQWNFFQAFDKPPARWSGRRFGLPNRRHRHVQTAGRNVFDGKRLEALCVPKTSSELMP
jgi:hypothetical protein